MVARPERLEKPNWRKVCLLRPSVVGVGTRLYLLCRRTQSHSLRCSELVITQICIRCLKVSPAAVATDIVHQFACSVPSCTQLRWSKKSPQTSYTRTPGLNNETSHSNCHQRLPDHYILIFTLKSPRDSACTHYMVTLCREPGRREESSL